MNDIKPRNIDILIQSISGGGAERQACILASVLSEQYKIRFICKSIESANKMNLLLLQKSNIHLIELRPRNNVHLALKLYKLFYKNSDIIFSYLLWGNFWCGIIGRLAGVRYRIGSIRSSRIEKNKVFLNRALQNTFNTHTIYNNFNGMEYYGQCGFNMSKASVIANAIQINKEFKYRKKSRIVNILSVGRFVEVKDYYSALLTMDALKKAKILFIYTIVGHGNLEPEIRDQISKLNLTSCVRIIIDPPNIHAYYKRADIYFQTSLFEGLSNTVMEAMSYGLPCVVTNVGDNKRLIIESKGGYKTNPRDVKLMTGCLRKIIEDYNKRIEFGEFNYYKIKKEYSLTIFKQKYIDFIDNDC